MADGRTKGGGSMRVIIGIGIMAASSMVCKHMDLVCGIEIQQLYWFIGALGGFLGALVVAI